MNPLYKVGDIVLVKSTYDPGCTNKSYRFKFTSEMLRRCGGKVYEITSVGKSVIPNDFGISDDGYLYRLDGNANYFYWVFSMFEPEF